MKSVILCMLFAFIPFFSFAQGLIEPGYYIDLEGQKHEGYFLIMETEQKYPDFFLFKTNRKSTADTLFAEQVNQLEVMGFHYLRADTKLNDTEATTSITEPKFRTASLFLKMEVKGPASLFSYRMDDTVLFFLSVDDEQPEQLIYQEFLMQDNRTSSNTRFRYQLEKKLDCHETGFDGILYTKEALIEAVTDYNNCTGNDSKIYSGFPGLSLRYLNIALSAGMSAHFIESYQTVTNEEMVHFSDIYIPKFGVEVEYLIPSLNNRFSIYMNADYHQFQGEVDIHAMGSNQTASLNYQAITTSTGIRSYFKLKDRMRLFVDLGYGKDFEVGNGITISYSVSPDFEDPALTGHLTGGIGLAFLDRYLFEARFRNLSTTISNSQSNQRVVQSLFSFNLKYLLKSYYK